MLFTNLYESNFNENLRGAPEGAAFGAKYAEELAQKVFNELPELNSSGSAEEVLDAAWDIAREELGDRKARSIFAYDEDFAGDLVTAYDWLQRGGDKEVDEEYEAGTKGWRVTWSEAGSDKHTSGLLLKPHAIEHAKMLQKKPGTSNVKIVPYNSRSKEVAEGMDLGRNKYIVTYDQGTGKTYTALVPADDEYEARDRVSRSGGRGTMVQSVKLARGNEPTHKEWKVYSNPNNPVSSQAGLFDREQGVAEGYSDMMAKERKKRLAAAEKKKQERLAKEKANKKNKEQDRANDWEDETDPVIGSSTQFKRRPKGVAEGHADQQRKIVKKNGKPVGEVGIDRESSPGNGQWYMKCYATGHDLVGYDSMEEALAELKHCLKQGVAEGEEQGIDNKYRRTAKKILKVYETNPKVKAIVDASPEFYRALVYETGVIKNPEHLDGTTHYHKLVDELESINLYGREQGVAEGSLAEYGDTPKGQKKLTQVQKRAVDRVTSKKADTDPKYAKKNQQNANAAWERMADKDLAEGETTDYDKEYGAPAPKRQPYRNTTTPTPGVVPDDEEYFREIWRKNREAKQKQETGTNEGAQPNWANPASKEYVGRREAARRMATQTTTPQWSAATGAYSTRAAKEQPGTKPSATPKKLAAKKLSPAEYIKTIGTDEDIYEGHMGEIAAEYEDYKKLSPREFFNIYKITKQQWLAKYKNLLPQQGVVQGADLKTVAKANLGKNPLNLPAGYGDVVQPQSLKSVAEADKKKDDLEPQVRDVGLRRAITRAKADFPAAGSGIEALAKGFMRSQDEDQQSFDQIRAVDQQQDKILSSIAKIDQEQEKEIKDLDSQNSALANRLQQLQSVNSNLEKKLAAMTGRSEKRKADKQTAPAKSTAAKDVDISTPDVSTTAEPKQEKPKTAKAPKVSYDIKPAEPQQKSAKAKADTPMKSTAKQLAKTDSPMSAMADRITKGDTSVIDKVTGQKSLAFEPSDNVLEPVIKQTRNPKHVAARADATDVDPKYYADMARKIAVSPEKFAAAMGGVNENDEEEADYDEKYQSMVSRVGQKARQQEKEKPVDIADLARRLAAIQASKKDE